MDPETIYKILSIQETEYINDDNKEIIKNCKENFLKYNFFFIKYILRFNII